MSLVSEESFGSCTVQCFVLDVSLVSCIIIIPIYFVSLMEKSCVVVTARVVLFAVGIVLVLLSCSDLCVRGQEHGKRLWHLLRQLQCLVKMCGSGYL